MIGRQTIEDLLKVGGLLSTHATTNIEWFERSCDDLSYRVKAIRKSVFMSAHQPAKPLFILDVPLLVDVHLFPSRQMNKYSHQMSIRGIERNAFKMYSSDKYPYRLDQLDQDYLYEITLRTLEVSLDGAYPFADDCVFIDFITSGKVYLEVLGTDNEISIPNRKWLESNLEIDLQTIFKNEYQHFMVC